MLQASSGRRGAGRLTLVALKLTATLVALLLIFPLVDPVAILEHARNADGRLLTVALTLMMLQFPLVAIRWPLIARALSDGGAAVAGTFRFQQIAWIPQFFGQVLPIVAGDGMRVLLLREAGPTLRVAFKSTVLDRAVAAVALLVIALPAALFSRVLASAQIFLHSVLLSIAAGLLGVVAVLAWVETIRDLRDVLSSRSYAAPVIALCFVVHGIEWRGKGVSEQGFDISSGEVLVRVDPRYFRPTEVDLLLGDPYKAREKLGWRHRVKFADLVTEMVDSDLKQLKVENRRYNHA